MIIPHYDTPDGNDWSKDYLQYKRSLKTKHMPKSTIKQTVKIKTNEENPEPMELVAQAIIDIANGFKAVENSRMKQRAVILLLHDATGVPMNSIKTILEVAPKLKDIYIKELKK